MFLYDKFFKSTNQQTTQTDKSSKLFLLYGAKNARSVESSYLIGVFDTESSALVEKDVLDNQFNFKYVGKTIFNKKTNTNEYVYKHYIVECELNKNYKQDIEISYYQFSV